jgi:hypothetical protein
MLNELTILNPIDPNYSGRAFEEREPAITDGCRSVGLRLAHIQPPLIPADTR